MVFDRQGYELADAWQQREFVVMRAGASADFLATMGARAHELRARIVGPERPAFLELDVELSQGERDAIFAFAAGLTRTQAREWILAECQLKGYGLAVPDAPNLHKDRSASELAIGIPIIVPGPSDVVVYPDHAREPNPFASAHEYAAQLDFRERPEVALFGVQPERVTSEVGDVVAFPGASMFHGRERAAGVVILYLKLNRSGLDPRGVDPRTYAARRRSLALAADPHGSLGELQVRPSPLLTRVCREHVRSRGWRSVEIAHVHGHKPLRLSDDELQIVLALAEPRRVAALLAGLGIEAAKGHALVRRLVRGGVLDLVELEGVA